MKFSRNTSVANASRHFRFLKSSTGSLRLFISLAASLLWAPQGWAQAQVEVDLEVVAEEVGQKFGPERAEVARELADVIEEIRSVAVSEQVASINTFFNRRIRYVEDDVLYGQEDYWASPVEMIGHAAGDCEDFAIAKYLMLRVLGVRNEQLRLIYVRAAIGGNSRAHMVLGYYPEPQRQPLILDSLISNLLPADERTNLTPVFSFNSEGLWVGGKSLENERATERFSRWRSVLNRAQAEGFRVSPAGANPENPTRKNG